MHLEVRVEGRVELDRIKQAVRTAAQLHPMARARLGESRLTDVRYRWEIDEELEHVAIEQVVCDDPAELTAAREALLSRTVPLDRPGPFALLLAHAPDGDVVLLNLHHAAGAA